MYKLLINMRTITKTEMVFALTLLKNPSVAYNSNSLAKELGITSMGALKIGKHLIEENILYSKQMGKAYFYSLNKNDRDAQSYFSFLLVRERIMASPYVKRWIRELEKLVYADLIVLFGSILINGKLAHDIDVLFVTDKKRFPKLEREIEKMNKILPKKIHPVYQSLSDFKVNVLKNPVVTNAIKGIVVKGEEIFIREVVL